MRMTPPSWLWWMPLHSDEIQEFINTTYQGSVLPID